MRLILLLRQSFVDIFNGWLFCRLVQESSVSLGHNYFRLLLRLLHWHISCSVLLCLSFLLELTLVVELSWEHLIKFSFSRDEEFWSSFILDLLIIFAFASLSQLIFQNIIEAVSDHFFPILANHFQVKDLIHDKFALSFSIFLVQVIEDELVSVCVALFCGLHRFILIIGTGDDLN